MYPIYANVDYFLCACVPVSVLRSRCVATGCLGNRRILLSADNPLSSSSASSEGSRQRSELRCQEGRFRDDNSPPAPTPPTIFHTARFHLNHTGVPPHGGGAGLREASAATQPISQLFAPPPSLSLLLSLIWFNILLRRRSAVSPTASTSVLRYRSAATIVGGLTTHLNSLSHYESVSL